MTRINELVERNIVSIPYPVQNVPAGNRADVIPDSTGQFSDLNLPIALNKYEIAYIQIFNGAAQGGTNVYLNIGGDADPILNYKCYIVPGGMYNVKSRQRVSIWNPGGAAVPIAVTVFVRNVNDSNNAGFP